MMNNMFVLLSFVFWGCTSQVTDTSEETGIKVVQTFYLENRRVTLELLKDDAENSITIQTKRNGILLSKCGYGNSDFQMEGNLIKLDTLNFAHETHPVYMISTYIKGSTFGAGFFYLIYKDVEWGVMRVSFPRCTITDIDSDGYSEIIDYKHNGDSTVYTFQSGLLLPDTP